VSQTSSARACWRSIHSNRPPTAKPRVQVERKKNRDMPSTASTSDSEMNLSDASQRYNDMAESWKNVNCGHFVWALCAKCPKLYQTRSKWVKEKIPQTNRVSHNQSLSTAKTFGWDFEHLHRLKNKCKTLYTRPRDLIYSTPQTLRPLSKWVKESWFSLTTSDPL